MKKNSAKLLISIVVVIVISIIVLVICYNKSFCEITYELFLALFTGCVFAIPSYIVIYFESKKEIKRSINSITKEINEILSGAIFDSNYRFRNSYDNEIKQLTKLSYALSDMATDYYTDYELIDSINTYIFKISYNYYKLKKDYNFLTESDKNSCFNNIKQAKGDCLSVINDLLT